MLGGRPSPTFPGNEPAGSSEKSAWQDEMDYFSKYLMSFMVPWNKGGKSQFSFDFEGLCNAIHEWDRRKASVVNRQRFRMMDNFISKGNRNSKNEILAGQWRERCADFWSQLLKAAENGDLKGTMSRKRKFGEIMDHASCATDYEAEAKIRYGELLELTSGIAGSVDEKRSEGIKHLRKLCIDLHAPEFNQAGETGFDPHTIAQKSQPEKRMPVVYLQNVETGFPLDENGMSLDQEYQQPNMKKIMRLSDIKKAIREMEPIRKVDEIRINNPSAGDGGPHEIDPQLDGSAIGGNFEEHMTVEGKPLTDEQRDIITSVVAAIRNNEQVLLFLHSGGGTGKSTVIRALNKILDMHGFAQANSCPTGVGAMFLDKGKTFHSLFRAFTVDLNASGIIDDIKRELGGDALKLVVVDEVSMLKSEYLLLLHKRLASMYDPNKPFGGISVILLGDFLQLPTVAGTPLYKTMYGNVKPGDAQVRALFQQFRVIEMQQQLRAGQCEIQQRRLLSFRALPSSYPKFGSRWSKADMEKFQPITEDVLDGVMTELKREEVEQDDHWTTSATCLTTTNLDRIVINNIVARIFGAKMGQAVVRWKRQFRKKFDVGVKEAMDNLLYLEDKYPELFGYFVYGAPAQILDNGNGNVSYGVANGTSCKMVALAWDDPSREKKMHDLTSSIASTDGVINLEYPPDYIIVQVNIADATNWPAHLNLSSDEGTVYIPIGLKTNRGGEDKDSITLSNDQKIAYLAHAVDLSFAITTWKSQGGTFEIVVVLLESYNASSKQKLSFELLYVMFSRVKNAGGFRCLPLSAPLELRKKLRRLYPNIFAAKYRMDINEDGFWDGSKSEEQSREQPKTKTHRNQPKAAIARQKHKEALKKK
jgi:energy-coupling factor transporter ATP-binding protein EcfA2